MDHLINKINHLKWLRVIGIDYYFLEPGKQSKNLINTISTSNQLTTLPMSQLQSDNKITVPTISNIKPKRANANINSLKNTNSSVYAKRTLDPLPNATSVLQQARELADKATNLEELKKSLMAFEGCSLKKLANNTVFADGNPNSSIMLIGEAPGSTEDTQGIPFCGESGQLLDKILASINISRKDNAYITNTVFWRPPANRQPTLDEIDICRPFVEKHIALIKPKLIILVGNVAATSLLGKNAGVTKIRQEYYWYTNPYLIDPIQTTAIFHPAYLLRQPLQKKTTWYDLLRIQEFVNINIRPTNS
ncbi:uracil-DNA glycosylase family protein [Candidatus Tisiphia endosymbiont of Nemotelus uliginosus]|uniref:uracil-DNA glycosylase n=1 Tax=Candidatus Tisiphia endosymbiont of Nemotelus uliginosus TaxID=3077926 RepID=UPI0035C8B8CE